MQKTDLLSGRIRRIDTSEIRKVFNLAAQIKDPINLSIGQPDFPVPAPVKEALVQAVTDNKNAYSVTQGILPLREKLSETWQGEGGFEISPENIVISTGVASILFLLFEVLFNPGDEILMLDPYFLIYDSMAGYHDLKSYYLPENFTGEDIDRLKKDNPAMNLKAIIFASPSNPTGKILDQNQLKLLAGLSEENDALLIADEIYSAYDYDKRFIHAASLHPERTLTLGGFSKSHAMTGLRVGYLGAPAGLAVIAQKVATLQQYSIVCAPQPAQWAALKALDVSISNELEIMRRRRNLVVEKLKDKVEFTEPEGAFYVFPRVPIDCARFVEKAIEKKLLIVPGHIFSKQRTNVRISYAQEESILEKGLDIFLNLVSEEA